jgi:hypothetical protein
MKKDSKKWQKEVKEKQPRAKTQYSRTIYPKEYANTVQPVTVQAFNQLNGQLPPTTHRRKDTWEYDKDPITDFFLYKKNPNICSGAAGYISSDEILSFFNNKNSRPSNFLFQIVRGSGGYTQWVRFFLRKSACHSKDFFKIGPLQGFTSKEPRPNLIR